MCAIHDPGEKMYANTPPQQEMNAQPGPMPTNVPTNPELHPVFQHGFYLIRKKFIKILGGAFHVFDENNNLIFFSEQKGLKLKEDLRIYSDESKSTELLKITTPQILDLGATYNVVDSSTGMYIGALRRKMGASLFKDTWHYLDHNGQQIGMLTEPSMFGAMLSRFMHFIPQKYVSMTMDGREVSRINMMFNPIILKYRLTINEALPPIDRRLIIAGGILLAAIEGRQK